jgi:hypothetical protein
LQSSGLEAYGKNVFSNYFKFTSQFPLRTSGI